MHDYHNNTLKIKEKTVNYYLCNSNLSFIFLGDMLYAYVVVTNSQFQEHYQIYDKLRKHL